MYTVKVIDWSHCQIFRRRFWFFHTLIAEFEISDRGNTLYLYRPTPYLICHPQILIRLGEQAISDYRTKN